jgi:UDPglucose--hexose-1-phosphate uridylyltransferase
MDDRPHRRLNPLTGDWILVSPHRARRPWQGKVEAAPAREAVPFDPACYLCPGNARAGGKTNPDYEGVFVFDNDFPALLDDEHDGAGLNAPVWRIGEPESGVCRVVCYSPRHDLHLAALPHEQVRAVVETWIEQWQQLMARSGIGYVQIFENRGEVMGCSNPHPHGQIWATRGLPNEIAKEVERQASYRDHQGRCLLCDVVADELAEEERVVDVSDHWVTLVPYWALWPFEVLVLPRRHVETLDGLEQRERDDLARAWQLLLRRYDRLFEAPMPLSCGWHQLPAEAFHLHAHFYPPLLRSATVRKFMVGYEMLAGPQRDITAEQAAARLRSV